MGPRGPMNHSGWRLGASLTRNDDRLWRPPQEVSSREDGRGSYLGRLGEGRQEKREAGWEEESVRGSHQAALAGSENTRLGPVASCSCSALPT